MANPVADTTAIVPATVAEAALPVASIALDGGSSTVGDGAAITGWAWTLLDKPAGSAASLQNPTTQTPNLINVDTFGTYVVHLVVTNDIAQVSESDPLAAGDASFVVVEVESTVLALKKPGYYQRNYRDITGKWADQLIAVQAALTAQTIASHSDTTATGAELETLTDGSNADALHTHAATALSVATQAANGVVKLGEAPVDPANPKAVTQARVSLTASFPGIVDTVAAGNASQGLFAFPVAEAVTVQEFDVTLLDGGTIAGGGYTVVLYDMTFAEFEANNWGAATAISSLVLAAPSADNKPTQTSAAALATAVAAGQLLVVRVTAAPAGVVDLGYGLTAAIGARRLF